MLAVTKSDLVTMALANLQYEIDEDGTKTTYFDFQMLQRQVVHRFISGKPIIKAQVSSAPAKLVLSQASSGVGVCFQPLLRAFLESADSTEGIGRCLLCICLCSSGFEGAPWPEITSAVTKWWPEMVA